MADFFIHAPPNEIPTIERIYVIVSVDGTGEGIMGIQSPTGWVPAITANERVLGKLEPTMTELCKRMNRKARLITFESRRLIREIG